MTTNNSRHIVNTGQYRKCFNQQILEVPSTLSTISATEIVKELSGAEYRINSVDGNKCNMTASIYKLWDLILLKLTEVVPHHSYKGYKWDECDPWYIDLSLKTIVDCLNLSTRVDALTHLYDRIIAAANVLKNIRVTVTKGKNITKIDGFLSDVAVRDCSHTQEHSMTKSNALFSFVINPELIAYLAEQNVGIYHFNGQVPATVGRLRPSDCRTIFGRIFVFLTGVFPPSLPMTKQKSPYNSAGKAQHGRSRPAWQIVSTCCQRISRCEVYR